MHFFIFTNCNDGFLIYTFQSKDVQFLSNRLIVDLSHNQINQINLANIEKIASNHDDSENRNVTIIIEDNPIHCDCEIYSFLKFLDSETKSKISKYVKFEIEKLSCDEPENLLGWQVKKLRASSHKCLVETETNHRDDPCTSGGPCDCWIRPSDESLLLDCSNRNLQRLPKIIDSRGQKLVELDLSENDLNEAPNLKRKGFDRINYLNLAGNSISNLTIENVASSSLKVSNGTFF